MFICNGLFLQRKHSNSRLPIIAGTPVSSGHYASRVTPYWCRGWPALRGSEVHICPVSTIVAQAYNVHVVYTTPACHWLLNMQWKGRSRYPHLFSKWYFCSLLLARRQKHVVVTCLTCGAVKRFLTQEKHLLWSERPENIVPPPPG